VSKRAGKRFRLETSWTEQDGENRSTRRQIRPHWDWRVPENAVMQQEEGQAFWINRGRSQQALTVQVPVTRQQIVESWEEIRQQEEAQQIKLKRIAQEKQERVNDQKAKRPAIFPFPPSHAPVPDASNTAASPSMPSSTGKIPPSKTREKQLTKSCKQQPAAMPTPGEASAGSKQKSPAPVSPSIQGPQMDVTLDVSQDNDDPDYL
jgi:hypothetical protein